VSLSENERTWPGAVPIEVLDPPAGAAVLDLPGSVTEIRYRAPIDAASQLTNGSFLASIDLGDVTPTTDGPPVPVAVRVTPLDPRVQVIDFAPRSVNVRVDQVVSRPMTVSVERGTVPEGLDLGAPVVTPATVILRGASSRVAAVQSVIAQVAIDASGLNVDQEVDLEAVDETGAPVPGVEIIPQRVHVAIDVARELAYATLPVVPVLTGDPADGYRVTDVSADPQTLTVSGEAAAVERMSSISTMPLDVTGLTEGVDAAVAADLPPGVSLVADEEVQLHVDIAPDEGSRTWQVGIRLDGARASRQYSLSTPTVQVTLAGPLPALDSLEPSTIDASVVVGRLAPGTHEVDVVVEPIEGLELVSVAPDVVRVEVAAARSTDSLEPSRSPGDGSPAPASASPRPTSSVVP
jgi:YbbR domain-containing protein